MSVFEPAVKKIKHLNANAPRKRFMQFLARFLLIAGWLLFLVLAYKVTQIETEHKEYDPFAILGLDRAASDKEIKKRYRDLSKTMHPDKGGDETKFKVSFFFVFVFYDIYIPQRIFNYNAQPNKYLIREKKIFCYER